MARADRRVLVTGGCGFIGAHLCRALAVGGDQVEAWARPGSPTGAARIAALPGVDVREVDVCVRDQVAAALVARPPDLVFHLAGVRLMGNRADNLARMFQTNVLGAMHVVEGLRAGARVVVVGSCEEYGRGPVPFREEQAAQAQTAYAVSRLATTLACLALASPPICVARLAVVYGPEQVGDMFIPSLLRACAERRPFGMTTGEQTRDFLYVDDAVRGLVALSGCAGAMGRVVNVASGEELTVRHVAELAARLAGEGADLRVGEVASRPGEASRYVCAIDTMRSLTGWGPEVGIEEGLARTIGWWRERSSGR